MGYSDIGCYGGEIETPNLDRLAANGLRFTQFYNTARCSPTRASMLTGLHPHQTGVGILTYDSGPEGYAGNLNQRCVTIPQVLKAQRLPHLHERQVARRVEPDEADRHLAAAARLRRVLRHDHRRRQLLRPEHADPRQRERRARGAAPTASSTPTRSATRRSTYIDEHAARACRTRRSSSTSPTPRRTGRCTRTRRTSRSTRAASTPAGTRCARSASTSSSRRAS